ncbi:MAG: hypothetical protein GYA52_00530 [Chloroflexi bacterium]|jgi:hypothetical protein|nr:hypothetical protein [Chloroflexota bacterium]
MGYLDPGFFGLLSQIGTALLLVVISAFTFFSKPIKKFFNKLSKKEEKEQPSEKEE